MIGESPQQGFPEMDFSRKYQRPIAVSLCLGIAAEVYAYGDREYSCLSLPPALSVCAVSEPVLPHIEYPDIIATSSAAAATSLIAWTGTTHHPLYSPLPPAAI
jgi:hypothetical protein